MTDRELLELAAKATGIEVWPGIGVQSHMLFTRSAKSGYDGRVTGVEWNPLTDDGDALRLAVVLNMEVYHADDGGMACYASWPTARGFSYAIERHGVNAVAATRRAIVRAAAAIGETMP